MCANEVEPTVVDVAWPVSSEEKRSWSSLPESPLRDSPRTLEDQSKRSCFDGAVAVFPTNSPVFSTTEPLPQLPRCQVFCPDEPLCLEDAEYPSSMLGVQAPTTSYVLDTPSPQLRYTKHGSAGNEAFERTAWEARCRMIGIMPCRPDYTSSEDDGSGETSSDAHEEATLQDEPFVLRTPSPLYDRSACWAWIQEQEGRDSSSPPMRLDHLLWAEGLGGCCSPTTPSTSRSNCSSTSSTSNTNSSHGTMEAKSGSSAEAPETIALRLACMV